MSLLDEVISGIDQVSKSIKNVETIVEAIQKGKGYLKSRYPDVKEDVCKILGEMNETLITTSGATSILTNFSFINDPGRHADDLREFNNKFVKLKSEIVSLRQDIDEYRGHCSIIRDHAEKIKKGSRLDSIFKVFGIQSVKENDELNKGIERIYNEEEAHYIAVYALCENLEKAVLHVHETLGAPDMLKPEKVPDGQALLSEYRSVFMKVESEANYRVMQIRRLIKELS